MDLDESVVRNDARLASPAARAAVLNALDNFERGENSAGSAQPSPVRPAFRRASSMDGRALRASFRGAAELVELLDDAPKPPTLLTELLKERDDELRVEAEDHDDEQLQQPDEPPAASDLPAGGPDLYECIKRDAAASRIQQAWRLKALGHDSAKLVHTLQIDEGAALEAPSHEVAKDVRREMLPHHDDRLCRRPARRRTRRSRESS